MKSYCQDIVFSLLLIFLVVSIPVKSFSINNVKKMSIMNGTADQVDGSYQSWMENHKFIKYLKSTGSSKNISAHRHGKTFKWNKCNDDSDSLLNVQNFYMGPDPLHFPGDIYLQFAGTVKETLDAPLQLSLTLEKEITSSFWIKVPCIGGLGSCHVADLCERLQGATCPNAFVKNEIPCKCPFPKGAYKMQRSIFHSNFKDVPSGNYYIKAKTVYKKQLVSCIEIYFSISDH